MRDSDFQFIIKRRGIVIIISRKMSMRCAVYAIRSISRSVAMDGCYSHRSISTCLFYLKLHRKPFFNLFYLNLKI